MIHALPYDLFVNPLNALFDRVQTQSRAALCAAVNHLLVLEPELQAMLAHHSGGTFRLRWPPLMVLPAGALTVRITEARLLESCLDESLADVTVTVLEGFLSAAQDQKLRFLRVEGDAMLAQTLALLSQRLRWDVEHDLARWVGNDAAGFLAPHARGLASAVVEAAKSVQNRFQATRADGSVPDCSPSLNELKKQITTLASGVQTFVRASVTPDAPDSANKAHA